MLALDPPLGAEDRATLGGVVAANDSGPLRHRYGSARDLVVGITVALADGTVAKAGGKVIKNVAGYDLAKLFTGSFGSLGTIVDVSVRLHPLRAGHGHGHRPQRRPAARSRPRRRRSATRRWSCTAWTCAGQGGEGALLARVGRAEPGAPGDRVAAAMTEHGLDAERDRGRRRGVGSPARTGSARITAAIVRVSGVQTQLLDVLAAAQRLDGRVTGPRRARAVVGGGGRRGRRGAAGRARAIAVRGARLPAGGGGRPARSGRRRRPRADAAREGALRPRGRVRPVLCVSGPIAIPAWDSERPPEPSLIDDCVHCGFCLPPAPRTRSGARRPTRPRGRIVLMDEGHHSELSAPMVGHLDNCLGCMACVTACPSGVKYDRLIEDTRGQVERKWRRPLRERLLRRAVFALFPHPRRLRALAPLVRGARLGRRAPFARIRELSELAPPAPRGPRLAERTPARGERRGTVALPAGLRAERVLRPRERGHRRGAGRRGVRRGRGCRSRAAAERSSSMPGSRSAARERARATIAALEGFDHVVANAAGCGSAMKDYGHALRDDDGVGRARRRRSRSGCAT